VASLAPHPEQRRTPRARLKVIHRHRIGESVVRRVSELVFLKGRAVALLDWIDLGGVRTPMFTCELDRTKLHASDRPGIYQYDAVTVDPRFQDGPAERQAEHKGDGAS